MQREDAFNECQQPQSRDVETVTQRVQRASRYRTEQQSIVKSEREAHSQ